MTEGSARNAKNHIAIGRTVKQILSRKSKHSQSLLNIATPFQIWRTNCRTLYLPHADDHKSPARR